MLSAPADSRRAWGFLGSLAVHVALVGLIVWVGPQVREFVWDDTIDGSAAGGPSTSGAPSPTLGSSRVGQTPSQPTRLQQLGRAMSTSTPAPAPETRVRLAIERVLDHLWQSTAFAAVVGLLALVLRRNRARVRYALWLAASIKFLVPMALIIALGRLVSPAAVDDLTAHPLIAGIREPLTAVSRVALWPASAALDPAQREWGGRAVAGAWAFGFALIAAMRIGQWRRLSRLIDAGAPLELTGIAVPEPIEVRTTAGIMEPGLVGWQPPVLLMPTDLDQHLTKPQVEAIVAHELCHARRFDNLTGTVHMIVEAIFWFHPLVWWIGTQLVNERERACDEHVLRTVGQPVAYAEGIVAVCKRYARVPLACVSGVGSSTVRTRVEAILANRMGERIGPVKRVVVGATLALVMIVPLSVGAMSAPWLPGLPGGLPGAAPRPSRVTAAPTGALALVMARPDRSFGPGLMRSARGLTTRDLAGIIASVTGYPVVDRTGLVGRFDFQLTQMPTGARASLGVYLEQQLGLKLVPAATLDVPR
jgi:beta-lactamase regulating signal transducer with metallopeptidase domain